MPGKQPKPLCKDCKAAKLREHIYWTCRKNCVHRNNLDTCIMKPVQFEPREPEPSPEKIDIQFSSDTTETPFFEKGVNGEQIIYLLRMGYKVEMMK